MGLPTQLLKTAWLWLVVLAVSGGSAAGVLLAVVYAMARA